MPSVEKSRLPRLPAEWYQGHAMVFWTHTVVDRATGWLDDEFHARFREILLHACARDALSCPVYVLMPDHWHLVWLGLAETSDQLRATRWLRKVLQPHLRGAKLQDQAHDHVLRAAERTRTAFMSVCHYVRENPVRAGLCTAQADWKYGGAMLPGNPEVDPWADDYWDRFWRIYAARVDQRAG